MPKKPQTAAQTLRQLVKQDRSINYVHRQTGVAYASLYGFVTGASDLCLETAQRLIDHYGLVLVPGDQPAAGKRTKPKSRRKV